MSRNHQSLPCLPFVTPRSKGLKPLLTFQPCCWGPTPMSCLPRVTRWGSVTERPGWGPAGRMSFLLTHCPDSQLPDCSRIAALDRRQERRAQVSADSSLPTSDFRVCVKASHLSCCSKTGTLISFSWFPVHKTCQTLRSCFYRVERKKTKQGPVQSAGTWGCGLKVCGLQQQGLLRGSIFKMLLKRGPPDVGGSEYKESLLWDSVTGEPQGNPL